MPHRGGSALHPRLGPGILRGTVWYMRLFWLFIALVSASILAYLQHWALADYLYWYYPWFDTLMHFSGGFAVGSFGIALLDTRRESDLQLDDS